MASADSKPRVIFLTVDDIVELHRDIIEQTGGESGILNRGNLEFSVDFVRSQVYSLKINDTFLLAAMLARGIISGHPFVDGNKRTGIESADFFLNKNGYVLIFSKYEDINFTFQVAMGEMDLLSIRDWLEDHSGKY
jgi:death-on-curing protein